MATSDEALAELRHIHAALDRQTRVQALQAALQLAAYDRKRGSCGYSVFPLPDKLARVDVTYPHNVCAFIQRILANALTGYATTLRIEYSGRDEWPERPSRIPELTAYLHGITGIKPKCEKRQDGHYVISM